MDGMMPVTQVAINRQSMNHRSMHLTPHVATMHGMKVLLCVNLHIGAEVDLIHGNLVLGSKMPVFVELEAGAVKVVIDEIFRVAFWTNPLFKEC
jgi:hypothetical protein